MSGRSVLLRRILSQQSSASLDSAKRRGAAPAQGHEAYLDFGLAPVIVRREPQPATTSSAFPAKSCAPGDTSPVCQKPVSNSSNTTLPIVLGILIPLIVALAIFLVLHRRHVRRQRSEDANDRNKSLDFGMDDVNAVGRKRGKRETKGRVVPEMSLADTEKTLGLGRGMSLEMDMTNPYMLPPELQQSRESLHSLSRTMNHGDDKYRPATTFIPNDGAAAGSFRDSRGADDSSSFTASTSRVFAGRGNESNQSLVRHAQRMSRSTPPTRRTSVTSTGSAPASQDPERTNGFTGKPVSSVPPNGSLSQLSSEQHKDSPRSGIGKDSSAPGLRKSNAYLGSLIRGDSLSAVDNKSQGPEPRTTPPPSEGKSTNEIHPFPNAALPTLVTDPEPLNFDFPDFNESIPTITTDAPDAEVQAHGVSDQTDRPESNTEQYEPDFGHDARRLTMGIRPLPPDDPTEDPEQRAIRIRSFYKEYFDEAKPGPVHTQQDYQTRPECFDYNRLLQDEFSGRSINQRAPFAQPVARRAMTPPPRGPSNFRPVGRMAASMSGAHFVQAGPRAYSSASGRFGASGRGTPKKKLPPPAPLPVLPTPHLLKDDSLVSMDFAPPSSFRERRAGTPDSLKGGLRPYSPSPAAPLPLASSFDDLAVMPSPHALRKSGTFTALDFAPPPRFRSSTDTRSDAGSIRSNGSGMSAAQLHSIRAGAYRVSRIPQELGGTKMEFAGTLRPQWDMTK